MVNFNKKREMILQGKMSRVILLLAGPIMLNNFIQTIYNLTDTYFVSSILGSTEMAAIGLIWPIIFLFISIGFGVNIASTSLISQYIGDNNREEARAVSGQVLTFSLLISIILGIVGAFLAPLIVKAMGGENGLYQPAVSYLRIMLLGQPTLFLFLAYTSIKQGQGDTVTPMIYSGFSVALNILLDPFFIIKFGAGGAALATVLARGIFALISVYTLFTRQNGIKVRISDLRLNSRIIDLIKIGLPSSIGQSTTALGFAILNIFIKGFGTTTLAAFVIGNRINSLILMPAMGIGNALATIVGQNLGADQIKRARDAVKTSALLTTSFLVSGGLLIFPLIPTVIGLFTQSGEQEVVNQGIRYLQLITLSLPLMGFFQIFIGTFQGSGHTVYAMIMMMGRLWALRIPMIILFKQITDWGSNSVWYAMVLSNALISLIGFMIYLTGKWQVKVIKDKDKLTQSVALNED